MARIEASSQAGESAAQRETEVELRVSTLELFFDLVFVLTITQLASLLARDLSAAGALQVFIVFVVLFWMYGGYAWLTNQVPPVSTSRRLLLVAGMAGFFVCALAIPRSFTDASLVFGLGYLLVVLVHGGLYMQVHGRAVLRFMPFNIAGAGCVMLASRFADAAAYALWLAPIALQYVASYFARGVDENARAGFDIRPSHFVERHGGLLIVVFGESVVGVGIGVADQVLDLQTTAVATLGLVLAAALWWTYFATDEEQAKASLSSATLGERVRMALNGYFYAFIPMLLGVTALAAGIKLAIAGVQMPLQIGPALLLAGGVALYLFGDTLFRRAMHIRSGLSRVAASGLTLTTIALGVFVSGFAEMVGLLATLVVMLALESASRSLSNRHARLRRNRH